MSDGSVPFVGRLADAEEDREETRRNIRLIIRIRYIVSPSVFVILAAASLAGFGSSGWLSTDQLLVNGINLAVLLALNVTYRGLSRRLQNLRPLVLFQLLIDVIHITLTVYKTGGVASPFGFLYFFVIFEAAILRGGGSTWAVAIVSSLLYSLTTILVRLGWVPAQEFFSPFSGLIADDRYIILSWAFAVASYFGFAALAGYLTGLLARRQRRLRQAYAVMTRRHETLLLLHRTAAALNTFGTTAEVCDAILGELLKHLELDRALLYRVGSDRALHLAVVKERSADGSARETWGEGAPRTAPQDTVGGLQVRIPLEEGSGLTARAAVRQESYNVADPETSPYLNRELAQRIGMHPFALAPLVVRGRTIGVLGIDRGRDAGAILNEEFRVFEVFANQAAITLHSLDPGAPAYEPREGPRDELLDKPRDELPRS